MHALFEIDLPLTLDVVHLPSANKTIFYLVVNSFTTAILCVDPDINVIIRKAQVGILH